MFCQLMVIVLASMSPLYSQWIGDNETDTGAACYLPLDETSGSVAAGLGPDRLRGRVAGKAEWGRGRFGNGLHLDGKSSLDIDLDKTAPSMGTIQLWVSPSATGKEMCLWHAEGNEGSAALFLTERRTLEVRWEEQKQAPLRVEADASTWRKGQWHQVALLWNVYEGRGLLLQFYVDGKRRALKWSKTGKGLAPKKVVFGRHVSDGSFFTGVIDEVRVLKVGRTPMPWAEIAGPILPQEKSPVQVEAEMAAALRPSPPEPRLERTDNQLVFHNNRIGISFLDESLGLGLTNIFDVQQGTGFGAKPKKGYRGLVWRISLRTDRGRGRSLTMTNRIPSEKSVNLEKKGNRTLLKLQWSGIDLEDEPDALEVRVTISLERGSPFSRWRITVNNRSRDWSLWEVFFPEMDLGQIGREVKDDYLVIPRAEGRCHRNPIYGWSRGFMTGASQPYGHGYPGGSHMQFAAYYEKDGGYYSSAPRRPGLYLATEDGALNVKTFFYTNLPQIDTLSYEVLNYPEYMVEPGRSYSLPYDFVAAVYEGDWFDAARVYRRWAQKQLWCSKGPLLARKDIPDWFRTTDFFLRADSRKGATAAYREMCRAALKTLHPPVCIQWYNWMPQPMGKAYDLTQDLPPREGIREAWKGSGEEDIRVFPYVNAQIWETRFKSFQQARPYSIKDEYGRVVHWSSDRYASMCRTQPWYRNQVAHVCEELVKKYGASGLYLDQLGNAFSGNCFDPTHGHPLGGGSHAVRGAREIFRLVQERAGSQVPLLSEASSEENIDISAGKIIHYNIWPGFVPLFSAVYHDYWTFFGRTVGGPEGDPLGYMNMGMIFVIGGQIGRIWPGRLPNALQGKGEPWLLEQAQFLKQLVAARKAGAKFLRYGEMLRPLSFPESLPAVETKLWRDPRRPMPKPVVLPAVLSSAWRAPDGHIGLALVNISNETIDFTASFDAEDYGLKDQENLTAHPLFGNAPRVRTTDSTVTLRMNLPAHTASVSEL